VDPNFETATCGTRPVSEQSVETRSLGPESQRFVYAERKNARISTVSQPETF
jgi:hypothetical protein